MRLREITEQRQQINEVAPIVAAIWAVRAGFAAYGMYSAYQGYQTFRSWQNDEISDREFASQIGQDAFNALAGATGGLAALKAAQMGWAAWRGAWAAARAAGSSAANAALASTVASGGSDLLASAYDVYVKYNSGQYDMERVRRELGQEGAMILRDIILFYGVSKVVAMPINLFRRKWIEAARNAGKTVAATLGVAGATTANQALTQ